MQLDIAVESVLTANGAMHELLSTCSAAVDAVRRPQHGRALGRDRRRALLDVESDAGLVAFSQGLYRALRRGGRAPRHPGRRAARARHGRRDRARRDRREAGGELYLAMDNCPHQAVLVGEAAAAERARAIAAARGLVCEQLPYDRAVHTPLFAPFAEDLRGGVRRPAGRPRADAAVVVHDRGALPRRPRGDPRAAGGALDRARAVPRDDRGAATTTARACSSRPARAGT